MVKFGLGTIDRVAFTGNVSESGLHLRTNRVLGAGSKIEVELKLRDSTFTIQARVAWAKRVPPQLARVVPCGMGIRIVDRNQEWIDFVRFGGRVPTYLAPTKADGHRSRHTT